LNAIYYIRVVARILRSRFGVSTPEALDDHEWLRQIYVSGGTGE